MTKRQLIFWSLLRDVLDVVGIGQIPGLNWVLNVPLIIMHFHFAGMRAWLTLFENIPVVETLPFFTVAALSYPDPNLNSELRPNRKFVTSNAVTNELSDLTKAVK
jgi:hypothetical protein